MQKLFERLPDDILGEVEKIETKPHINGRHIHLKNGFIVSVQWGIGLHDGVDYFDRMRELENELSHPRTTEEYFEAYFNNPRDAPMGEMMVIKADESWFMVNDSDPLTPAEILKWIRTVMKL